MREESTFSEATVIEMRGIFFPLAGAEEIYSLATEFVMDQFARFENPRVDLLSLRRFIQFYLDNKV
jgi:hypothetical protein